MPKKSGFTLIELACGVLASSILFLSALSFFLGEWKSFFREESKNLRFLEETLEAFDVDWKNYRAERIIPQKDFNKSNR